MRQTFDMACRVTDSYVLERGGNRLRIDIEERRWPEPGLFTASAYVMIVAGDGHERWTRLEIPAIREDHPERAFEAAADALKPRLKDDGPLL